jgi:hypothetical protein
MKNRMLCFDDRYPVSLSHGKDLLALVIIMAWTMVGRSRKQSAGEVFCEPSAVMLQLLRLHSLKIIMTRSRPLAG